VFSLHIAFWALYTLTNRVEMKIRSKRVYRAEAIESSISRMRDEDGIL
jgi:hypothetical protein